MCPHPYPHIIVIVIGYQIMQTRSRAQQGATGHCFTSRQSLADDGLMVLRKITQPRDAASYHATNLIILHERIHLFRRTATSTHSVEEKQAVLFSVLNTARQLFVFLANAHSLFWQDKVMYERAQRAVDKVISMWSAWIQTPEYLEHIGACHEDLIRQIHASMHDCSILYVVTHT